MFLYSFISCGPVAIVTYTPNTIFLNDREIINKYCFAKVTSSVLQYQRAVYKGVQRKTPVCDKLAFLRLNELVNCLLSRPTVNHPSVLLLLRKREKNEQVHVISSSMHCINRLTRCTDSPLTNLRRIFIFPPKTKRLYQRILLTGMTVFLPRRRTSE